MSTVLKGEHFKKRQGFLQGSILRLAVATHYAQMTSRCSTLSPRQPLNSEQSGQGDWLRGQRCEAVTRSPPVVPPRRHRAGRPRQPLLSPVTWPLLQHSCQSHYSSDSCPVVNYSTPLLTSAFQIDVFSTFHDLYCVCWAGWLASSNVDGWCFIPFNSVTVLIFVQTIHFLTC